MAAGLILLFGAGCAPGHVTPSSDALSVPEQGGFYHLDAGRLAPLSREQCRELLQDAAYVLLGEGHTVACDHVVQARVIEMLGETPRHWAVGLEMLGAEFQPVLDEVNKTPLELARDLPRLEKTLGWSENWGYGFALYAPPLQAALRAGMPLFALNVQRDVLLALRKKGRERMTPEQAAWLPERIIPPLPEQQDELLKVFTLHQEFMTGKAADHAVLQERLQRFFTVQSIWDTAMALRAKEARQDTGRPVIILAGSGHVENGWGIAHRLHILDPEARVVLVMPWRGGEPPRPGSGDVFYFCPESATTRQGLRLTLTLPAEGGGESAILVEGVEPGSLAAAADLRPGDMIVEADGRKPGSLGMLHVAGLEALRQGRPLRLVVVRNGYRLWLTLPVRKNSTKD